MEDNSNLQKNIKKFPIYKMFAWDLLFYYAIIFLFLVKAKGLTTSQILFADAFYTLARFLFQIFCIRIIDRLGSKNSLLFGNICINIAVLIIILCKGVPRANFF